MAVRSDWLTDPEFMDSRPMRMTGGYVLVSHHPEWQQRRFRCFLEMYDI